MALATICVDIRLWRGQTRAQSIDKPSKVSHDGQQNDACENLDLMNHNRTHIIPECWKTCLFGVLDIPMPL